jgi:D-hydroxyproline dehydrogenase subunit gamma
MSSQVIVTVNGASVVVPASATVAVAVAISGQPFRTSVSGEPRAALCAMGICYECRVTIDGIPHRRSCQILCEPGMEVKTDA